MREPVDYPRPSLPVTLTAETVPVAVPVAQYNIYICDNSLCPYLTINCQLNYHNIRSTYMN